MTVKNPLLEGGTIENPPLGVKLVSIPTNIIGLGLQLIPILNYAWALMRNQFVDVTISAVNSKTASEEPTEIKR
jgi:hypothetical protein